MHQHNYHGDRRQATVIDFNLARKQGEYIRDDFAARSFASAAAGIGAPDIHTKTPVLEPNIRDISVHLHALFPPDFVHAYPDAQVELVYGPPDVFDRCRWFSPFDLKTIVDFAEVRVACGDNIYVGAALRRGPQPEPSGRANKQNYLAAQHAWCEYDKAGDHDRVVAICGEKGLQPAIIVTTGTVPHSRCHLYFKIDGINDAVAQTTINKALCALFKSDDKVTDAIRVLRLAGSINTPTPDKYASGYIREMVTVQIAREPRIYTSDELLALCGRSNDRYDFNNARPQSSRDDDALFALLEKSRTPHEWHDSMLDATGIMLGRGWSDAAIKFACAPYCRGGKDDPDIPKLIDKARIKWNKPDHEKAQPEQDTPKEPDTGTSYLVSSADFLKDFTPPDYLIDGWLQHRFIYSFTGNTGHAKTAIALLITVCVALGKPLGDLDVVKGHVLYFAGENPDDIRMRWMAMAEYFNFDINVIDVHFLPGKFTLSQIGARIIAEVEKIGSVALVVVDTSAAFFEGDDENHNVQAGNHARILRSLLRHIPGRPCGIICCHPVKNATQDNLLPRGGGAFVNEMDGNLTSWKTDSVASVHWQGKFRGPDFAPISFGIKSVTAEALKDSKGRLIPSVIALPLSEQDQKQAEAEARSDEDRVLLALMKSKTRRSMAGLAESLCWLTRAGKPNKSRVQRVIERLRGSKLVVCERDGLGLTAKGEKEAERVKAELDN